MKILVAGATGSLGGRIARGLLERGDDVRCLVRERTDPAALREAGAAITIGDLRDAASLGPACRGIDVVISTASATRRGDDSPENVDARGHHNLISAAREAGVDHFIVLSTIGASLDSPVPAFRAKAAAEEALRSSGIAFTIVQPNAFMDVWFGALIEAPVSAGQPVTLVGESRRRHSFIAEDDVAAFVLAATRQPAARNTTLVIGGPAAITFRDAVYAYEAALGRTIPVRSVPPGEPIPGVPEPVWGIAAALESYDSPIPMDQTAASYGVSMTSVAEFARRSRLATGSTVSR
ncbi:MAG: SDR family oxidoreductase [Gemmatimonadetes bacterium]|nr:SDR family oxidoreductase [Gemmatimonadota bacterium]